MSYKALINSNVRKAFNLLKDLAEDIQLTKKTSTSFNFSTLTAGSVESAAITTKAVITDSDRKSGEKTTAIKLMLLKTQDIGDILAYDKVTLNSQTWLIGPVILSDNYITAVEVYKEA